MTVYAIDPARLVQGVLGLSQLDVDANLAATRTSAALRLVDLVPQRLAEVVRGGRLGSRIEPEGAHYVDRA